MDQIIKQIRGVLGNHWTSQISIHILADEVFFGIYESEIPIIVDLKGKEVYMDCEGLNHHLSGDMLLELCNVVRVLESNLDVLSKLLEWKEEDLGR